MAKAKGNPRGSGYKRAKSDWYVESREAAAALFDAGIFARGESVFDPFSGSGNIVGAAQAAGLRAIGSDLAPRHRYSRRKLGVFAVKGAPIFTGDFWSDATFKTARGQLGTRSRYGLNVVTNPPYKGAEKIVTRTLEAIDRKAAFLLPLKFLEGQRWWRFEWKPVVYVFTDRISCPPGAGLLDGTAERRKGFVAFAWFVWDRTYRPPEIIVRHITAGEK